LLAVCQTNEEETMLKAYINYPNPHISAHGDLTCPEIGKQQKQGQRRVQIDVSSISSELREFINKEHRFGSVAASNDMWLELNFSDPQFEMAVLEYIQREIGKHYKPLATVEVEIHCGPR
jgi:hypothetical protein